MSIESGSDAQEPIQDEASVEKETPIVAEPRSLARSRRNIAKLIESGNLTPEMAEKLAKLNLTEQIETVEEQMAQPEEESLIKKENGIVDFGKDDEGSPVLMKVFKPEEQKWTPKFFPTKDGRYLAVGFVASDGTEFVDTEMPQMTNDNDPENPEVQAAIEIEKKKLDAHLEKERAKRHIPPEKRGEFRETESSVETMRKMVHLLNHQEQIGRGLLVVEGEAGTGKNWMLDHIAHLTERPIFRFTCDASKETPELKYFLEFVTDEKGSRTVRISSTIIESLQTEGAILELDEINTLRPEVAKSLNSLFDADRAVYFGEDDVKVKAARGVLLVGLMNPAHYAGVNPLAETVKSRARIIAVDYPKFEDENENGDQILRSDEAEMVYQHFSEFQGLGQGDFQAIWHQVVNGRETKNAQSLLNQGRQIRIKQMKMIVRIANHIREAYRQYQENESGNQLDYNFTLRETSDCALELSHRKLSDSEDEAEAQVRKIVLENIQIKFTTPEERKNIEALIREA